MIHPQRTSPLRLQFIITSLPVGGAETLLLNLVRRLDRFAFAPEVVCLKDAGPMGPAYAREVPLHCNLLTSKFDVRVVGRLSRLFQQRSTDAVITVGAGDKMFWGRLAAKLAGVPVICSALHSTGWPDGVGWLNRWLTWSTDAFIAVAKNHAEHLRNHEKFPADRVFTIPNGVDIDRFRPNAAQRDALRRELDIPTDTPLVGIVAALREEKNHAQFVQAAREVLRHFPRAHFVIVGDGPLRSAIESDIAQFGIGSHFHLLGTRDDAHNILAALDVFCLTSKNEANPVSILEALACGIPVVSPNVGSVSESVVAEKTGILTEPLSAESTSDALVRLLGNTLLAKEFGSNGRQLVSQAWSLDAMVSGYAELIAVLYNSKMLKAGLPTWSHSVAADVPHPQLTKELTAIRPQESSKTKTTPLPEVPIQSIPPANVYESR